MADEFVALNARSQAVLVKVAPHNVAQAVQPDHRAGRLERGQCDEVFDLLPHLDRDGRIAH